MGSLVSCFSSTLVTAEKMSLWATCTLLICCLVSTITIVLGLGIGLGYNYCFIDMQTKHKHAPATRFLYPGRQRWSYPGKVNDDLGPWAHGVTTPRISAKSTTPTNGTTSLSLIELAYNITTEARYLSDNQAQDLTTRLVIALGPLTESEPLTVSDLAIPDVTTKVPSESLPEEYYDHELPEPNATAELRTTHNQTSLVNQEDKVDYRFLLRNITKIKTTDRNFTSIDSNLTSNDNSQLLLKDSPKVIPINSLDLLGLLSKLRVDGKNFTLQLIT